jgi:hypothetical protein
MEIRPHMTYRRFSDSSNFFFSIQSFLVVNAMSNDKIDNLLKVRPTKNEEEEQRKNNAIRNQILKKMMEKYLDRSTGNDEALRAKKIIYEEIMKHLPYEPLNFMILKPHMTYRRFSDGPDIIAGNYSESGETNSDIYMRPLSGLASRSENGPLKAKAAWPPPVDSHQGEADNY